MSPGGGWLDVHVQTPPWICGPRDGKGLYAKAQAGIISEFTGISDPYEVPETPEVRTDTRENIWDLARTVSASSSTGTVAHDRSLTI